MSSHDPAASTGDDSSDARQAAASAAREEAIRALLNAPPDSYVQVPPAPRVVPASSSPQAPLALSEEFDLPVAPSATRLASAPYSALEVSLGLLVIVLAAVLAFVGTGEFRARTRAARCAAELRTLAAAFEQYRSAAGEWPAMAAVPGAVPPGMEKFIATEVWTRPTPLGGHYAWLIGIGENRPALGITAFVPDAPLNASREEQERIDRQIDDGNLATGRFRAGFNGWPVYFLTDAN